MLSDFIKKVKGFISLHASDLFVTGVIFLIGIGSFGLGRLSVVLPKKEPLRIQEPQEGNSPLSESNIRQSTTGIIPNSKGTLVGSKSGTAYHFPWCPGALKIKEENKIWFADKKEAEAKGYHPAGNCPGL